MFRDAIARLSIVSFATVGRPLVYLGDDYLSYISTSIGSDGHSPLAVGYTST